MSDYHINVFHSEEDAGYIADIPDLQSCSAFGLTPQEALTEVLRAKEAWLSSAQERGIPIPQRRYRPNIELDDDDDDDLSLVMSRYQLRTRSQAVALALRRLAGEPMTRAEALAMQGVRAITESPVDQPPVDR